MFFLVAGVGHCGTQWLASFLDRPDEGMTCWHEQKFRVISWLKDVPYSWMASLQYEIENGLDERFDEYFDYVKEAQRHVAVVGEAHAWEPFIIPQLAERLPVDQIIYLVRNGVQNVHSLYYHNVRYARDSFIYEKYLRMQAEMLGLDWSGLDDWGKWCAWWATNSVAPENLKAVAPVQTVTLETLTEDPRSLIAVAKSLQHLASPSIREAKQHAGIDINRKIEGDRKPERLWSTWTDNQRETFTRVCGAAMAHFGYEIPGPPGDE